MKKIIAHALAAGIIFIGVTTQLSAGPLAPIVNEANHLRSASDSLNYRASKIEEMIRYYQSQGENPVYLKRKARKLRKKAKRLALRSNSVAKEAFDLGYHRPNHSHHTVHYHYDRFSRHYNSGADH